MSTLSLAPTTTEITEAKKIEFRCRVFMIIVLTYLVIIDVSWSVVEELPVAKESNTGWRPGEGRIHWATNMVEPPPSGSINRILTTTSR